MQFCTFEIGVYHHPLSETIQKWKIFIFGFSTFNNSYIELKCEFAIPIFVDACKKKTTIGSDQKHSCVRTTIKREKNSHNRIIASWWCGSKAKISTITFKRDWASNKENWKFYWYIEHIPMYFYQLESMHVFLAFFSISFCPFISFVFVNFLLLSVCSRFLLLVGTIFSSTENIYSYENAARFPNSTTRIFENISIVTLIFCIETWNDSTYLYHNYE